MAALQPVRTFYTFFTVAIAEIPHPIEVHSNVAGIGLAFSHCSPCDPDERSRPIGGLPSVLSTSVSSRPCTSSYCIETFLLLLTYFALFRWQVGTALELLVSAQE